MAHPKKALALVPLLLLCLPPLFLSAQAESTGSSASADMKSGIDQFRNGQFDKAVALFQKVVGDPSAGAMKAGALFLIAKSYMATGKLDEAGRALDSYLVTYGGAVDHEEALYQKGRLLFMQDDLEGALRALQAFVVGYPASPFVSSAWFWAAESLYGLGRLDDARSVYSKVISDYPTSVKIEAARYRIELIQVRRKEVELARLLKWSHEDYLRTVEDYQNRERAYAQVIESYQKRLAGAASSDDQKTIADLRQQLAAAGAAGSSSWLSDQLARLQQTLAAKEAALALKEKALNLIDSSAGAGN